MDDISRELQNTNQNLKDLVSKLERPFEDRDNERRHSDLLKIQNQTTNLSKWLLIATVLLSLTAVIQIMEKWGAHTTVLDGIYVIILILVGSLTYKVLKLLFANEN